MYRGWKTVATFTVGLVLASACGAPASPLAPTSAPTMAPTTVLTAVATNTSAPVAVATPTSSGNPAEAAPVILDTAKVKIVNSPIGKLLVADNGMTLYIFTKDTPNTSVCYNGCATSWPPLLTKNAPQAGDGVDGSLLGTTGRKDGSLQVTFNGMPVYFYFKDKAPGDLTGQGVGGVWFVVGPRGIVMKNGGKASEPSQPGAGTVALNAASTKLGQALIGDQGMTLYVFAEDGNGTSNCYDKCATAWPPFITKGKPAAGSGVDATLLGTTTRKDGSLQVTYKGMPLYYYVGDKKQGDVTGQNVGGVWFMLAPSGDVIKGTSTSSGSGSAYGG